MARKKYSNTAPSDRFLQGTGDMTNPGDVRMLSESRPARGRTLRKAATAVGAQCRGRGRNGYGGGEVVNLCENTAALCLGERAVDIAAVGARDYYGRSALHRAANASPSDPSAATVESLLKAGADHAAVDRAGSTPLHLAAAQGRHDAVASLLVAGADPSARDRFGRMPLALAAETGSSRVVAALLCAGADPGARDRSRRAALHRAAARGHAQVVQLLLAAGAPPGARDDDGRTALHHASEHGYAQASNAEAIGDALSKVARQLLAAGADASARDWQGHTSLHLAATGAHVVVSRLLMMAGAQAERRDARGRAPADCCPPAALVLRRLLRTTTAIKISTAPNGSSLD